MRVEKNLETKATQEQMLHWEKLYELYDKQLIPQQELFSNFGLFLKTSSLAKILFLNEIYEHISTIPGDIVEFGSWWGQNLITFENLRAIYEPFNKNRHIIGFDTFSGYRGFSNKDKKGSMVKEGNFSTTKKYYDYLSQLMDFHEKNNVLGNIKKHLLVKGDVRKTVPTFFKKNLHTQIALAYFDLALYEPTKICLKYIKPRLFSGSIIVLDEFNEPNSPGESIAFREIFNKDEFTIQESKFIRDRTIIRIK
jgi:hypothetical protein